MKPALVTYLIWISVYYLFGDSDSLLWSSVYFSGQNILFAVILWNLRDILQGFYVFVNILFCLQIIELTINIATILKPELTEEINKSHLIAAALVLGILITLTKKYYDTKPKRRDA